MALGALAALLLCGQAGKIDGGALEVRSLVVKGSGDAAIRLIAGDKAAGITVESRGGTSSLLAGGLELDGGEGCRIRLLASGPDMAFMDMVTPDAALNLAAHGRKASALVMGGESSITLSADDEAGRVSISAPMSGRADAPQTSTASISASSSSAEFSLLGLNPLCRSTLKNDNGAVSLFMFGERTATLSLNGKPSGRITIRNSGEPDTSPPVWQAP